jgi:hypothetical protein
MHAASAGRILLRRTAIMPTGTNRIAQKMLPLRPAIDALVVPVTIVTATVVVLPSMARPAGTTLQVEFCGAPAQVRLTVAPATAGPELKSSGNTPLCPLITVTVEIPFAASAKSTPVPFSASVWGEPGALDEMVSAPVRAPPVVGVKAICSVHAAATASVLPHVFEPATMAKSPLIASVAMERATPPLLANVTVCGAELRPTPVAGKVMPKSGESETPAGATPVPLSVIVCVRYWSETISVPAAGPSVFG